MLVSLATFNDPNRLISALDITSSTGRLTDEGVILLLLIIFRIVAAPFTTTTEEMGQDIDDKHQLEHFIQVNYYNMAKESASGCGEYTDVLYDIYTDAIYNQHLTKDYLCKILRNDHEMLFADNEYNDDFISTLEKRINFVIDGL